MIRPITAALAVLTFAACSSGAAVPTRSTAPTATASATIPATTAATSAPTATPVQPVTGGTAINVLGTENFYADLLSQIGGTRVQAMSLLNDPNADPHEFEADPKAAAAVADAKLVIVNGIGYDDFMPKLIDASNKPDRIVINVQKLMGVGDDVNAHVWYDPKTMPAVANAVVAALSRLDPPDSAYFAAQKDRFIASLKPIDDKIAELKAKYDGAPVAFTEPVAGYQAAAIGLKVLTPEGFQKAIEDGVDPAPADVAAERDLLTGKEVKVLLLNSQVTSPLTRQIDDLAVKSGIPVVGVAETIPPKYKHYQDWMLGQLGELQTALGG